MKKILESKNNFFTRKSPRAMWYDNNGGIFFVTICTKNMSRYFGEILSKNSDEPQMQFSRIGEFSVENLQNHSTHYPYAEVPLFVVMPNHIHAIIVINDPCRDGACPVLNKKSSQKQDEARLVPTKGKIDEKMQLISLRKGRLSVVVGGLKSAITKFATQNNIEFAWQSRFHDHIVRDQKELNKIADYIENNVINWHLDKFNM